LVGIATGYSLNIQGLIPRRDKIFLSIASRAAPDPGSLLAIGYQLQFSWDKTEGL
jgi:hypothetical protein